MSVSSDRPANLPSPARRREPLPGEDYYLTDYEPTELLAEWAALKAQYTALKLQQQLQQPEPEPQPEPQPQLGVEKPSVSPTQRQRGSSPRTSQSPSASRQPRNSLALELFFARQRQRRTSTAYTDDSMRYGDSGGAAAAAASSPSSSESDHVDTRHGRESVAAVYAQSADPYDLTRERERQAQFLAESRRLGRPFVPVAATGSGAPTRLMLGDCVRDVYKCIAREWPRADPMVVSTAEDLIVVFFALHKLRRKDTSDILAFMNALAKAGQVVREYRLTRVPEGWDVLTDDGHLMYTFRPPWVPKGRRFLPHTVNPATAHEPQA